MNEVLVFFPYPQMSWEDAYQWAKERNLLTARTIEMTNPEHWDRESMIRQRNGLLQENTFAWRFNF